MRRQRRRRFLVQGLLGAVGPGTVALVEVRITKTIERLVLIRAVDVEAYRAAFEKDAAHMTRNTPPELPAYATVVETTRTAESIQTVRTLA